jgi:DNA polymerase III sliding clamp (beta) subunit (PCNA family)
MTQVTFETATIADAVRRAAKIAPGKAGHAFDKAAGLFLEINPGAEAQCLIRATNLEAFHTEVVAVVHADGDPVRWRLPSTLMSAVVGGLPPQSGSQVLFQQDGNRILIRSGKMKASMVLMDEESYPDWELFDSSAMTQVPALGSRISMVEWAASSDGIPPTCGVYLTGEFAVATDRYKLARVPCKFNLERPVIIPAGILGGALRSMGETGVRVDSTQLLLAPDDWTQLRMMTYDMSYFPVDKVFQAAFEHVVEVSKSDLLEKLNRAGSYAGAERNPLLRTFWGKGELAVMMENSEVGLIGDVIEVPGALDHARVEIAFTPKYLVETLNNAPDSKVRLHYSTSPDGMKQPYIKVEGGSGYEVWVMKRVASRPSV